MKLLKPVLLFCALLALLQLNAQTENRLMRFPTIYGNQVVFSYAGDLYTVASTGGVARKLTSDPGYEMFAKFSPDGKTIAFTAQYDGNTELYSIPAEGGNPKRLTVTATLGRDDLSDRMGPNNIVMAWTPDGKNIVYRSRKQSFNDFVGQLFTVSVDGGMSQELPLPSGGFCSYSPDGKKLAYNRVFREFRTWKYYKGGMADDIWIYNFADKTTKNITDNEAQDIQPMWIGDEIYFLSDRDRTMNLFCYNITTGATKKVTGFTDYDIKFPSVNGNKIVFERAGFIYIFDASTKAINKVDIFLTDDFIYSRSELKDATKFLGAVNPSPDGNRIVVTGRGDIFTVPVKEGITRNLTQSPGAHDREAVWSPDGKYIAWLSDMNGEYEIYMQKQDGSEPPVQLTKGADTYKYAITWSPDSKKILWSDRLLRLQFINIDTKEVTLVEKSKIWEFNNYDWSPDNNWIVFDRQMPNRFSQVALYNVNTKAIYDVTDEWFTSYSSIFSNDGKYLLFISDRTFNPIYSNVEWNYAYENMSKIYLIPLAQSTPSPFAPVNDEVSTEEKNPEKPVETDKKTDKKSEAKTSQPSEVKTIEIDTDGIKERIIELPVIASNYFNVRMIDDKIYYNQRGDNGVVAKLFDLKTKKETELGNGLFFDITSNGKKMLVRQGNQYAFIDLPSSKINLEKFIDLSDVKVWTDTRKEWNQIFDEAWRQMRDFFYVPNMHGVDWKAMHDKYAIMLPYVNHRNDLTYLIGEMIGELNIGHAYIGGGERPNVERIDLGLLGAKISKNKGGFFVIDSILTGENWAKSSSSPLSLPGVNAKKGEFITSVNGISTKDMADIYTALINKAGKVVELTLNSKAEEGGRKVLVTPIKDESQLYYYTWVQDNIRKVSEATNGEVGYIHVPDMGPAGLNEFVKYYYPQLAKKGLIIDDRGNGGGNVSPMLLERLSRELQRSTAWRNSELPGKVPAQMIYGPKVLLIDNYSASDGDLFPYGFKHGKLGTVIGKRTWGGVVGIRGSLPFIDGADLRKPEFASYSAESSNWIIEGYGVDPDIEIDNDPAREYAGIDDQLNKAIEVIKEQMKNFGIQPGIPAPPDKSK